MAVWWPESCSGFIFRAYGVTIMEAEGVLAGLSGTWTQLRWSPFSGKGAQSLTLPQAEQMNWDEMPFSLTAAGCEHDEIRCRHLPYRHVKLQETNPRRAHLYQLFATARAGFASPSRSLPRAGNSSVSWFLKCSHLINVTGLSVEICEWNIIVWTRKRVEGDELKVCPGLRLRATEPEPNVVQGCYL